MSADAANGGGGVTKEQQPSPGVPSAGGRLARRRLPLAPLLFFLGLGTLLLSWMGFMSYYVFVKAKQPKPIPEAWAAAASATNHIAQPAAGSDTGTTNRGGR